MVNDRFAYDYIQSHENIILRNSRIYGSCLLDGIELPLLAQDLAENVIDPYKKSSFIDYFDSNFLEVDRRVIEAEYYRGVFLGF